MRRAARSLIVASVIFALPPSAGACIWEYATAADGKPKVVSGLLHDGPPVRRSPSEGWDKKLAKLAADPEFATDLKKRNDYAVALIHLNRTAEAIPILEEIESKTPGVYVTAVNLGTAYELSGRDDLALKWIGEGLKRNPGSHEGTEWLHVRILEAKLALAKDPKWLERHSVFDGGEALTGTAAAPVAPRALVDSTGKARDAEAIREAVRYQLGERMQFVRPPEPIVAELLLELASVVALHQSVEQAMGVMQMAGEYKPARAALYAARKAHFESLIQANPQSGKRAEPGSSSAGGAYHGAMRSLAEMAMIAAGLLVLVYFGVRAYLRRRKTAASRSGAERAGR